MSSGCLSYMWIMAATIGLFASLPPHQQAIASEAETPTVPFEARTGDDAAQIQSRDVVIRDHRGQSNPLPPPSSVSMDDAIVRDHRKRADLIGRKVSSSSCGPGRVGIALIEVKNQGTGQSGTFFTQINSYNKQIRVRTGALPPGGAFSHQV